MQKVDSTEVIVDPVEPVITATRIFDAPVQRVFDAHTDPEKIAQWWSGGRPMRIDRFEAEHGGAWRFVINAEDGSEYGFFGVYHEVTAPSRIVCTFEFEGMPGHVMLEAWTFEEVDGKTKYTGRSVLESVADRDGYLSTGAEAGMRASLDKLAELVESD